MVSLTFLYVIREIIGFLEPGRTKANSVIFQFFASQKLAINSRFPNFGGGDIKLISFDQNSIDWFLRQLQISSSHAKYKLTKVFLPQWNFIQRYPVNMTANWLKNAIVCFSLIWKHRVHWRLAKIWNHVIRKSEASIVCAVDRIQKSWSRNNYKDEISLIHFL